MSDVLPSGRPSAGPRSEAIRVGAGPWLWIAKARRGWLTRLFATQGAAEAEAKAVSSLDADDEMADARHRYAAVHEDVFEHSNLDDEPTYVAVVRGKALVEAFSLREEAVQYLHGGGAAPPGTPGY